MLFSSGRALVWSLFLGMASAGRRCWSGKQVGQGQVFNEKNFVKKETCCPIRDACGRLWNPTTQTLQLGCAYDLNAPIMNINGRKPDEWMNARASWSSGCVTGELFESWPPPDSPTYVTACYCKPDFCNAAVQSGQDRMGSGEQMGNKSRSQDVVNVNQNAEPMAEQTGNKSRSQDIPNVNQKPEQQSGQKSGQKSLSAQKVPTSFLFLSCLSLHLAIDF